MQTVTSGDWQFAENPKATAVRAAALGLLLASTAFCSATDPFGQKPLMERLEAAMKAMQEALSQ